MCPDNELNFEGAARKIERKFKRMAKENGRGVTAKYIEVEDGIRWHLFPPGSPHFGGHGVNFVKNHLRRVLSEGSLTHEKMHTLLSQIDFCLNSRLLCASNDDSTNLVALTPGHFLVGTDLLSVPEPSADDVNTNSLQRWQQIIQMRPIF